MTSAIISVCVMLASVPVGFMALMAIVVIPVFVDDEDNGTITVTNNKGAKL